MSRRKLLHVGVRVPVLFGPCKLSRLIVLLVKMIETFLLVLLDLLLMHLVCQLCVLV